MDEDAVSFLSPILGDKETRRFGNETVSRQH
jgi:hypothetical protein